MSHPATVIQLYWATICRFGSDGSNTDNTVVGLIAEAVTGKPYGENLKEIVFGPANLRQTSFPTRPRSRASRTTGGRVA